MGITNLIKENKIKFNSLASKITIGFIITLILLGIVIFLCCEYFSVRGARDNYQKLTKSCAQSAAYALNEMPVGKYLKEGKNELYKEQLALLISICKNFGLKYLYVYVPDFKKNVLTVIYYVDGKTKGNLKNRELGTKVNWEITQIEKDTFNGISTNDILITNNYMGHTITSYDVVYDANDKPIALVGADFDFDIIKQKILHDIFITLSFIAICLFVLFAVLILYLENVFIKPVIKISARMSNFTKYKNISLKPLEVKSDDEIGLMAKSFNKMVSDIEMYIKQITETQAETIFSLAKLAQSRDDDTGKHLERVQLYCKILAKQLVKDSPYSYLIGKNFIENLINASPLHDIGKVGIPDKILLKPGKFTDEEYSQMKKHTVIGYETLKEVHSKYGTNSFIEMGMVVTLFHHERWDGHGYPQGLKGDKIPLAARIMAIADVYDALSSKRVYKPSFDQEKCVEIIISESGKAFDPILVDAFVAVQDKFDEVRQSMED